MTYGIVCTPCTIIYCIEVSFYNFFAYQARELNKEGQFLKISFKNYKRMHLTNRVDHIFLLVLHSNHLFLVLDCIH